MRLYGKVKANLRLSPAKLQEKTCKRSEKCKVNTVSRLAKDFLFHVCQCDLFDSHTVSSSFLSISIVNTKIKVPLVFFSYKMIKVILIVVHCLTQESLEVIFHPATLMLQPETLHRKLLFSDSLKSVSVSCSSKLCKVIIHHWALWPWDISGITTTTQTAQRGDNFQHLFRLARCPLPIWMSRNMDPGGMWIWMQSQLWLWWKHSEMELGIDWWIHGEIERTKFYSCKIFRCSEFNYDDKSGCTWKQHGWQYRWFQ